MAQHSRKLTSVSISRQCPVDGYNQPPNVAKNYSNCLCDGSGTQSSFSEKRCVYVMEGLSMGISVIAPDFGYFPYLAEHGVNDLLLESDYNKQLQVWISRL